MPLRETHRCCPAKLHRLEVPLPLEALRLLQWLRLGMLSESFEIGGVQEEGEGSSGACIADPGGRFGSGARRCSLRPFYVSRLLWVATASGSRARGGATL